MCHPVETLHSRRRSFNVEIRENTNCWGKKILDTTGKISA